MNEFEESLQRISNALDAKDKRIEWLMMALKSTTDELLELKLKLNVVETALARATREDVTI